MKKFLALSLSCMLLFFVGCSKSNSESNSELLVFFPYSLDQWRELDYKQVESDFRNAGFTNIVLNPTEMGWFSTEGRVCDLSIDSDDDNLYWKKYHPDAEVVITYYVQPTPSPTPEPIVYTTESESLAALFEETSFGSVSEIQAQYIPESGLVSIVYNIDEALSDKDLCSKAFLNYVRFVQALAAYQVDGVSEVSVCTQFPTTDSYGNKDITPVLSWSMTMESFQQYNWKNLRLREGVFIQFSNDCESFWVAPFMENTVDWNKVMLFATFELEE